MKTRMLVLILTFIFAILLISSCATTPKRIIRTSDRGDLRTVKMLIDKEVDVNVSDRFGYTALYWASFDGHTEIVKMLIDAEAV